MCSRTILFQSIWIFFSIFGLYNTFRGLILVYVTFEWSTLCVNVLTFSALEKAQENARRQIHTCEKYQIFRKMHMCLSRQTQLYEKDIVFLRILGFLRTYTLKSTRKNFIRKKVNLGIRVNICLWICNLKNSPYAPANRCSRTTAPENNEIPYLHKHPGIHITHYCATSNKRHGAQAMLAHPPAVFVLTFMLANLA